MQQVGKRLAAIAIAIGLSFAFVFDCAAVTKGRTPGGIDYVSGGVSIEELRALADGREAYSLWITAAAIRSGAHLADVRARIFDAKKNLVLDANMEGPWLFVMLPLGRYQVELTFQDQVRSGVTTIHPNDHHQAIFYFDSPAEVSPEWESPFKGSPYRGK